MPPLIWYWHRLRAMEPTEIAAHLGRKFYRWQDARRLPAWTKVNEALAAPRLFPALPKPEAAPGLLREALARDSKEILAGRWKAFGHLEIQVDDPPNWHKEYLAGIKLATDESALKLNHRELPGGADIKLIWELSRWHQLVRLAMAAHVLGDERAASKCVEWLDNWVRHNPPYRGWNWTSALEAGMRLVQFTWIDALLANGREGRSLESPIGKRDTDSATDGQDAGPGLSQLRREILPAHVRFAWRYRSFGSSANNHVIGELAGLILALARWPGLSRWATSLDVLHELWEREVLAQFAEDGGNKEQALNYHLFSWEFCWQTRAALVAAGRKISSEVEKRLRRAARFFWEVQVRREPWDYGDSDNAFVSPFFVSETSALLEWREWLGRSTTNAGAALDYWLGPPPDFRPPPERGEPAHAEKVGDWWYYRHTGMAICESGLWFLRWDLSPLGYLKTAAHGHLDALHLSLWFDDVAMVIDPGTGHYYADKNMRTWLASAQAHNMPYPHGAGWCIRLGPFLWDSQHRRPDFAKYGEVGVESYQAEIPIANGSIQRRVKHERADGCRRWIVEDSWHPSYFVRGADAAGFSTRWQFAPGARLEQLSERNFRVNRNEISLDIEVSNDWAEVHFVVEKNSPAFAAAATTELETQFAGTVSPAFRKVEWAPFLKLVARPGDDKSCVFRTTFLASRSS